MALIRVVLDACVMLPQNLNNVLLTLAEEGLLAPVWIDTLLDEVRTNLVRNLRATATQAEHRIQQMQHAFPFAAEEARGYEQLIPAMTNDRKNRHVLAVALEPLGVEAAHPDEFLLGQLDLGRPRVLTALDRLVARNTRIPQTIPELLDAPIPLVPKFAHAVHTMMSAPILPVAAVSGKEVLATAFPTGRPTVYTPLGAAMMWGIALANRGKRPRFPTVVYWNYIAVPTAGDAPTHCTSIPGPGGPPHRTPRHRTRRHEMKKLRP